MVTSSFGERDNKLLSLPVLFLIIWGLCTSFYTVDCAVADDTTPQAVKEAALLLEQKWGIKVAGIRLTAAGHLVDFRYRVIDPEKAVSLMRRGDKAFLVDNATGTKLPIPRTKVGPLRGTGTKAQSNRVYTVMFSNEGRLIQKGSKVTVVIGEFKVENLVVE
jgi:hypothetical protein